MDATVRFYAGVLGMRLVATTMAGRCGTTSSRWRRGNTVAFFEVEGAETFAKPAGGPTDRAIQLDHLSFDVPDEHALEMLRKRLLDAGSEVTEVVDHGFIRSVYFTDPNGIALEASWWVVDATGRPADYDDRVLFSDPDPVPAVAELRAGGVDASPRDRAHLSSSDRSGVAGRVNARRRRQNGRRRVRRRRASVWRSRRRRRSHGARAASCRRAPACRRRWRCRRPRGRSEGRTPR